MFCLTTSLKVGDIVLLAGGSKHSKIISAVTKGPFSHACIVVSGSQIIEALTSSGVQYTSCMRIVVESRSNIAVLRPRFSDLSSAETVRSNIEEYAKEHQSRGYGLLHALKLPFNTARPSDTDKYFCSQLVSALYREAGYPLFCDRADHNVSPNDFLRNQLLLNITDEVVVEVSDYVSRRLEEREIDLIGLDNGGSTTSKNALLMREFIEESGAVFKAHGLAPPARMFDVVDALTDSTNEEISLEIDRKLTKLFDSKGILAQLQHDLSSEPLRLDELKEEISIYGHRLVAEEYAYGIYMLGQVKKRIESHKIHEELFDRIHEVHGFGYAHRMREYYRMILKALYETEREMNCTIAFLKSHMK